MQRQRSRTDGKNGITKHTPLLIHISTDQVYSGEQAFSTEAATPDPVNVYGETKLEAEHTILSALPERAVILRSSIIYGPLPPHPVPRTLFVQFIVRAPLLIAMRDG